MNIKIGDAIYLLCGDVYIRQRNEIDIYTPYNTLKHYFNVPHFQLLKCYSNELICLMSIITNLLMAYLFC